MAAAAPALELAGLTRRFGALTAVDGLSLTVRRGELFGLVGPDGAGKTTTLRMLAGVLRPSAGEARLLGVSVGRDPERVKHSIAYMSQRFGLYTDLTVAENLDFYADLYRVPRAERPARLERLYRFSALEPFRERLAGQLSGGMKQKLALSCCLVHEPEILLLDEPTFGVDPISRRDLWLIVHEMVAHGTTVVVSTAYMDEAERFDRLAMLHRGRLLALDTADALQAAFPAELVALPVDRPREARAAAGTLAAVRRAAVFGDQLHLTVGSAAADGPAIAAALRGAGFAPGEPRRIEPSLEDVFIERIGETA
ncbi:MAG TPA: ABC transporter ATP-binding protein [Terriglobales bacterium]|nr:ABC transporter ATP-binding protein [Terriglobales bacterium]